MLLDGPHRLAERVDLFAGRLQQMIGEPLRAPRADAGQPLERVDQLGQRIRPRHQESPGRFMPPIRPCI